MQSDVVARRVAGGLQTTLRRLATLVGGLALVAFTISLATFATGWWVFHGRVGWLVIGGLLCMAPVAAAALGWLWVHGAARYAPRLIDDVATYLRNPSPAGKALIDYDSGQTIAMSARSVGGLKADLEARKNELPGLWLGIRTITAMPGIAAVAVVGTLLLGSFGTVLFLVGLFR